MMKSALFRSYFRESAVGVSGYMRKCGISLRSLQGQGSFANSSARQTPLHVRQSVGFVFQAKMRVVPRKFMFFRPNSPKENWDFFV